MAQRPPHDNAVFIKPEPETYEQYLAQYHGTTLPMTREKWLYMKDQRQSTPHHITISGTQARAFLIWLEKLEAEIREIKAQLNKALQ